MIRSLYENWTGVWYKNGGDYAYGENRYNDKADKTNGEDPDVAAGRR